MPEGSSRVALCTLALARCFVLFQVPQNAQELREFVFWLVLWFLLFVIIYFCRVAFCSCCGLPSAGLFDKRLRSRNRTENRSKIGPKSGPEALKIATESETEVSLKSKYHFDRN